MVLLNTSFDSLMSHPNIAQNTIDPSGSPQNIHDPLENEPRLIAAASGRVVFYNPAFSDLYGYDGNLEGTPVADLFLFDDVPEDGEHLVRTTYDGRELSLQFDRIDTRNGQSFLVASAEKVTAREKLRQYVAEKIENKHTNLAKRALDIDIENVIDNLGEAITHKEKQLREAESIARVGRWHWQIGSENLEFSDQLYKIFGLEKARFNPTLNSISDMIHRNDADRMMQVFQRAIIEQKDYDMDFRLNSLDGGTRFIRCEGRCKTDKDGEVIALYGIMQDVTESTKREIEVRQAKESVERAYAAKTQFLANMSHELRTPLNAVIGFSEMIERQLLGPIGNEKYLEYISGIRESGEHLLDLISDILDMSKIEAGRYELNLEKFNITKVVRLAIHMMEGRALDKNITITMNTSKENLQIVADRRAVMQMILNLLSNAVKFSKQDGVVTIGLAEKKNHFLISVEDNGIGIPANKLANITMPFEQAENHYTREYEGTGLGLAITKELAEIHGGTLHIESTVDIGTKVTIRLPYETGKA